MSSIINGEQVMLDFADKYLGQYSVKRKTVGGDEIVPKFCPFCNGGQNNDENTFALNIEKGLYVCKRGSCGQRGRFEELAEFFNDSTSLQRTGNDVFKKKKEAQFVLPDTVKSPPTEQIYEYFEKRKISRKTVDDFKIMSDPQGNIVFPFYFDGVDVFEKYRKPWKPSPEETKRKEWRYPGTKPILFGMDMCSFSRPLIITEGEIDSMSLYEAGIQNVVSVPSGCEDFTWLEHCYDWLEHFKTIVLFGDSDEPGRKMVQQLSKRLDESRCLIVEDYPTVELNGRPHECKDANEILYLCGEFELIDMVQSAKEIPVKGLIDLASVTPQDPTSVPRVKTMIPDLDKALSGLQAGRITVFSGKSGQGKSTVAGLLLLNALEAGQSVCAYSGELPKEDFQEWINLQCAGSDWIGLKYDQYDGVQVPYVPYPVQERIKKWYEGRFFLFDNNEIFESNQAEAIIDVFTKAVRKYDCKMFLVDNLMTSLSDADEELRAQSKFVAALKKFAQRYEVHVIVVAHPRKTKVGEKLQDVDVAGAAAIINLADNALVIERPDIRIIKNRKNGVQKLIECCYCGDSRRIYQRDVGDLNHFGWDKEGLTPPSPLACSLPEYGITFSQKEPF